MPRTSNPDKTVTTNCPVCGKEFTYYKCWPKTTCSMECRNKHFHEGKKVSTNCPECGRKFTYHKSWPRKYCSRVCASKNTVDNIPGWQPSAYETTCEQCGKTYTTTPKSTRGRFCCHKCFSEWQLLNAPTGPDHPNWKGGYIPYYGRDWRRQRRAARKRDGHTCQRCGITQEQLGRHLDVHHIKPFREFDGDYKSANKLENLISLCPSCHKLVETYGIDC